MAEREKIYMVHLKPLTLELLGLLGFIQRSERDVIYWGAMDDRWLLFLPSWKWKLVIIDR